MSPERFAVELTPLPTATRVAQQRGRLRYQIIITALLALVLVVAWLVMRWEPWLLLVTAGLWGLSSVFWITVNVVLLQRAKRDLASIGQGVALYIDPEGLEFVQPVSARATWAEISALRITGSSFGAGPKLVMEVGGSPVAAVPVSFLDATAAAIDSAVGARSLGRVRLDASGMDRLL
ncbi:MAG: hypothetical protein Q4D96_05880 [Propionibacteriaceae bacterium]|nr:hypothetical protein [Propionibacteriaceae bacterium]